MSLALSLSQNASDPVATLRPELTACVSRGARWTSWGLTGLVTLLMGMDALMKLTQNVHAVEGSVALGYPASATLVIGVLQVLCLVAYLVPRTSVLGAILFTGYFGGAVATHLRMGNPLFTHELSGVYVATVVWLSLWLRNPTLRALVPFRR